MEFKNKVNNGLICADDTPWYLKSGDEQMSCNGD